MDQVAPRTSADAAQAEARRFFYLVADRVIRPVIGVNRARLLQEFDTWLRRHQGCSLADLLGLPLTSRANFNDTGAVWAAAFRAGSPITGTAKL